MSIFVGNFSPSSGRSGEFLFQNQSNPTRDDLREIFVTHLIQSASWRVFHAGFLHMHIGLLLYLDVVAGPASNISKNGLVPVQSLLKFDLRKSAF